MNETNTNQANESGRKINPVLATGVFIIEGNKITFQRANYIEDGWYVEQIDEDISLWEIPFGGGEPIRIGGYYDLISAIKAGTELS